jgi:hypothetical protein
LRVSQRPKKLAFLLTLIILTSSFNWLGTVSALNWTGWCDGTCGEITEDDLDNYWLIDSIPFSGYEDRLWSNWHDVINSQVDLDANADWEIHFTTRPGESTMGKIKFRSKAYITDQTTVKIRYKVWVWFSYAGVRTLAKISLFDETIGSVHRSWNVQSNGVAQDWDDVKNSELVEDLNLSHTYSLQMEGIDAWGAQEVQVLFEYFKVAAMKPYYSELSHTHFWVHRFVFPLWFHLWICETTSKVKWSQSAIDDMLRDHRPYHEHAQLVVFWDPSYCHEFRFEDNAYVYENWWNTDLPNPTGDLAEQDPDALEIEIYTLNPHLLVADHLYFVKVQNSVWKTGSFSTLVEAEIGNQDDDACPEPPGYPAEYITIEETDFYHSTKSYITFLLRSSRQVSAPIMTVKCINVSTTEGSVLKIVSGPYYDVIVFGKPSEWLKIYFKLKIDSKEDLLGYIRDHQTQKESTSAQLAQLEGVPVSITFNRPMQVEELLTFVSNYGIEVEAFRFTGLINGFEHYGQGTPINDSIIPIEAVENFVYPASLEGFYRIDGFITGDKISEIEQDDNVLLTECTGYLDYLNLGINASIVQFSTMDPYWFFKHYM